MSDFHDPQLENALGRLSGEFPDDNVALGAVYQRVQQVRRRRTIVVSTTASLLLMAGVGVFAARGVHHEPLQPGASISIDDSTIAHTSTTEATTTEASTTEPATTEPTRSTTTTLPLITVTTPPPVNGGSQGSHGSQGSGHGVTSTTAPVATSTPGHTTTEPTTTTSPDAPRTYSTPGGWFTVRFANGRLTLVGQGVSNGFHVDSSTVEPQRIEFRFRGPNGDFRIRVEVKDGTLQVSN